MKKESDKKKKEFQALQELIEVSIENELISEDVLYKAFIEPFTDVYHTAKGELKKTITNVAGNARKVAMQIAAASLPFIASSEVKRIGEDEAQRIKQQLANIDSEYSDVLERNINALRQKDAAGFAFLFNPAVAIGAHAGAWAAGKSVGTAAGGVAWNLDFLQTLTSEVPFISNHFGKLKDKFEALSSKAHGAADKVVSKPIYEPGFAGSGDLGPGGGDAGGWGDFGESVNRKKSPILKEANFTEEQLNQKMGQVIQKLLARKDVQDAIQNSDITKMFKNAAIQSVSNRINQVAAFTNLDQFSQFSGSEMKKYQQDIMSQMPDNQTPEQQQEFEKEAVAALKTSYKKVYQKYLADLAAKSPGMEKELEAANRLLQKLG